MLGITLRHKSIAAIGGKSFIDFVFGAEQQDKNGELGSQGCRDEAGGK